MCYHTSLIFNFPSTVLLAHSPLCFPLFFCQWINAIVKRIIEQNYQWTYKIEIYQRHTDWPINRNENCTRDMAREGWGKKFFQHTHMHVYIVWNTNSNNKWSFLRGNWKQSTVKSNKPNEIFQMRLPFVVVVQTASPRNSDNKNAHTHTLTYRAWCISHAWQNDTIRQQQWTWLQTLQC